MSPSDSADPDGPLHPSLVGAVGAPDGDVRHAAQLDARILWLGGETESRRRLNRMLPWAVSVGAHLALIAVALVITWAVVATRTKDDPVLVVADFSRPTYAPIATGSLDDATASGPLTMMPTMPPVSAPPMAPPVDGPSTARRDHPPNPPVDWSPPTGRGASFAGVRSSNARRVAYVVDASGSMIGTLPIVIDELARSLRALGPEQSFAVFFFQRNEAIAVPPGDRLAPASPEQIDRTLRWIRARVVPAGRSNPMRALEAALRLRPDAVYLLSPGITGSGEFEVSQRDLLDRLDRLNPADAAGRRRAAIQCIQFIDVDPLDTLRRIAQVHGGENGFRFLTRAELGIAPK